MHALQLYLTIETMPSPTVIAREAAAATADTGTPPTKYRFSI